MFSQHNQVLNINYLVTPGHGANVAEKIVRTPAIYYHAHIGSIDNSVTVKVNDRNDWGLKS